MRVLVLSGHAPSPSARQAGQKTSYHFCEFLSRKHDVHLLSFITTDEVQSFRLADMRIFQSMDLVPVTNRTRLLGILGAPQLPISVAARFAPNFRRKLKKLLKTYIYDVVIMDHTAMWQYRDLLHAIPLAGGSAHDVLSQLWNRKASMARYPVSRWFLKQEYRRVESWERSALSSLDFVSPHSEKDSRLLKVLDPGVPQCPIQPWHIPDSDANRLPQARQPFSVVFWGAMNRSENIDAVRYAISEIIPKIRARVPESCFFVAGSHSESLQDLCKPLNIVTTGYLEDAHGFLSRMCVALLPLRLGAGIKVKTLECMAAGIAVVTTPVGIEGIAGVQGKHFLLGEKPEELADHVVGLLKSPIECQALGTSARELIQTEHQFAASMEKFSSFLTAMREKKQAALA